MTLARVLRHKGSAHFTLRAIYLKLKVNCHDDVDERANERASKQLSHSTRALKFNERIPASCWLALNAPRDATVKVNQGPFISPVNGRARRHALKWWYQKPDKNHQNDDDVEMATTAVS